MAGFDIAPFALPNCGSGEIRFEEPRDIITVRVTFKGEVPSDMGLYYLRKTWPESRVEAASDLDNPCAFGWIHTDDWFNCTWQKAAIELSRESDNTATVAFQPLTAEFPEVEGYDVRFRRTLGIKLSVADPVMLGKVMVCTASPAVRSILRVELDAGKRTLGKEVTLQAYNAIIRGISAIKGCSVKGHRVELQNTGDRMFEIAADHMNPAHRYCNDEGHVTFVMEDEPFTISIASLDRKGPIWFAEQGVYIARSEDKTCFSDYVAAIKSKRTIGQMVLERPEQSFAGAYYGQPRAHAVSYNLGCKHARQRFWLEHNGDMVLHKGNVPRVEAKEPPRFKNNGSARFFFGLERWMVAARFPDPSPVLAYNIHMRRDGLMLEQKSFAVPLLSPISEGETASDDTMVALVRFRFQNAGDSPATAKLPINYSQDSGRSRNALIGSRQDDHLVPQSDLATLTVADHRITSPWNGQQVLRCTCESAMKPVQYGKGIRIAQALQPGETCEVILKIPYVAIETDEEVAALDGLNFDRCYEEATVFWRTEGRRGARLRTPEPHLNALYASHLSHVLVTDFTMPDGSGLINTSVGTSTYGNFSNESCMIVHELDERGLHEEARLRLGIWIKYQGTAPQPGNFTDYEGMYFGAGGFESGNYNQHHGWVIWCICEHYFLTRDAEWFERVAGSVVAGADWVFRQRRNTMGTLPHSRGWEYGFLPAGSLEDVTDFHYWLSTNALTWRGVDRAASALEAIGRPEAGRIRKEADAYREDLIKGFETMRRHSPLVRLRDGRWVPHYPSRLYCRGRDVGWIREVLEGSVYLSGLYDPHSTPVGWILDDFQDNRYVEPPYGYLIPDFESNWFDRGGFSIQPNLLAGLMPYLERDEPELYIWMFFNAWCACYREEIDAMVEHPSPVLGYSNAAHFKTSDESNAVAWLRYMYVFASGGLLHLGRAIPRAWLEHGNCIEAVDVATRFGKVGIRFHSQVNAGKVVATAYLSLEQHPGRILVRVRHPAKLPMKRVRVNGEAHDVFDALKGDVDITGYTGKVIVEVGY